MGFRNSNEREQTGDGSTENASKSMKPNCWRKLRRMQSNPVYNKNCVRVEREDKTKGKTLHLWFIRVPVQDKLTLMIQFKVSWKKKNIGTLDGKIRPVHGAEKISSSQKSFLKSNSWHLPVLLIPMQLAHMMIAQTVFFSKEK